MSQELTEALFARGTLMGLHIGRWAGVKKMQPTDMLMANVDENAIYLGHKRLLPKKSVEKLVELEGKARTALAARSVDFPIAGARFVTYTTMPEVIQKLTEIKAEWQRQVDRLTEAYPELKQDQLRVLTRQAETFVEEELRKSPPEQQKTRREELLSWLMTQQIQNESFYPSIDDLKKKFTFTWRMFTISALEGIQELEAEEVVEAQNQLRADLQVWVRSAASAMHKSLGEAAANAREILEKNGKLNPRNLTPLFNAFENFLSVDFTGKSTFRETIDTIKKRFLVQNPDGSYNLERMAESINTEHSRSEITDLLAKVGDLAVEETAEKAGVVSLGLTDFGRFVEL